MLYVVSLVLVYCLLRFCVLIGDRCSLVERCCLLFVVSWFVFAVFGICCLLFVVGLLLVVGGLLIVAWYVLFGVCCVLFIV